MKKGKKKKVMASTIKREEIVGWEQQAAASSRLTRPCRSTVTFGPFVGSYRNAPPHSCVPAPTTIKKGKKR